MIAVLLAIVAAAAPPPAPQGPDPLHLVAVRDTVLVFLPQSPPPGGGFVVYRAANRAEERMVRLTPAPVAAARSAEDAAALIGPDLPAVERALRAPDVTGMWLRLQSDHFAAGVLGGFFRGVAQALGRVWSDTTAAAGATYTYRVVLTDADGRETRVFFGTVKVEQAPPALPTGLKATVNDHLVELTWRYPRYRADSADAVIGFVVYRADESGPFWRLNAVPVLRNEASPPVFRDDAVQNDVRYRYQVTAVDLAQREGPASAPLDVSPADRTPPGRPEGVVATAGNDSVLVVWRLSPEPDVAGYHVERAQDARGPYARLTPRLVPVAQPSYVDTTATGGVQYYYRIVAVDRSGNESEPSNGALVLARDLTPPAPPTGLAATVRQRCVTLRWHPSASRDVRGYLAYRSAVGERGTPQRLVPQPVPDTMLVDSGAKGEGLAPGQRYLVRVSAVDSAWNESARDSLEVTVPDDVPPPPPTGFVARDVGGRYAELSWSQSPAPDAKEFDLTRAAGDSAEIAVGRYPSGILVTRDDRVQHGVTYVYRLTAVDSAGNRSGAAVDTLVFARLTPPPAPRHVSAHAAGAGVAVVWERVADPELAGYRVYRSSLPTGVFAFVAASPAGTTMLTDSSSAAGGYYRVRAVDISGNESVPSPPASAGPGRGAP